MKKKRSKDFKKKKDIEFSKKMLKQESALIWIDTIACILLAFVCIVKGYSGSLPWISSMVAFPWGAYGASQAFYYNKSKAENIKDGIKFESMLYHYNDSSYSESDEYPTI